MTPQGVASRARDDLMMLPGGRPGLPFTQGLDPRRFLSLSSSFCAQAGQAQALAGSPHRMQRPSARRL